MFSVPRKQHYTVGNYICQQGIVELAELQRRMDTKQAETWRQEGAVLLPAFFNLDEVTAVAIVLLR
jgi:hypothetical protein